MTKKIQLKKKLLLFLIFLIGLSFFRSFSLAQEDQLVDSSGKKISQLLNPTPFPQQQKSEQEPDITIPDWLKRTSYGIIIESDQAPRIYLETIQPLYQTTDKINTFFTHGRISHQHSRGTYSLGLGYRSLLFDENLIAGVNTFFDYRDLHKHYRQGVGVEAIGKTLEFRANTYFRLSPKRLVEETSTYKIYEQVLNGFDTEIGGPVPYLPWFKIFGSYYHYNYKKSKDMNGWKTRAEIKPFKFITVNLETYDDNKGEREYRIDSRLNFVFDDLTPKSIVSGFKSAFKLNKEAYPEIDLKERTLDRVERDFNVRVERWKESGGATLEIGGRW